MFTIKESENIYKLNDISIFNELVGFSFGKRGKSHKINGEIVSNITIYNKELAHPIVLKQVIKKYEKLMKILPDLIIDEDGDGSGLVEALNEIEKFRQIIKNKYRKYLNREELEKMSKNLVLLKKEASKKIFEMSTNLNENDFTRTSRK